MTNRLNWFSEIRLFQYSETDSKMSSPPSSLERSQSSNDDWMYSSESFPRYGSEDEPDTDDPFWEFIDEPKYGYEEEESEEEIVGKEEESDTEDEHSHNIDDESDYDGDDEDE